jgi:hypothetical protein
MGNRTDETAKQGRERSSGSQGAGGVERAAERVEKRQLPKIDLETFILSLSTSALYQMGVVDGPDGEKREEPNRALAQQTIDTLEMLRDKTRGNLDEEEMKLFDSLLYELRMRFVAAGE